MKKRNDEMLDKYDFGSQKGIRGKYSKAYKSGHSVRVYDGDKLVSDEYFATIEPEVRAYFPNSKSINNALKKLISIIPEKPHRVQK